MSVCEKIEKHLQQYARECPKKYYDLLILLGLLLSLRLSSRKLLSNLLKPQKKSLTTERRCLLLFLKHNSVNYQPNLHFIINLNYQLMNSLAPWMAIRDHQRNLFHWVTPLLPLKINYFKSYMKISLRFSPQFLFLVRTPLN